MALDGPIDLLPGHPLLDVRVVGDRLQGDVLHPLVHEPVPDVAGRTAVRQRRPGQLTFLETSLGGIGQQVVREPAAHKALPGEGQGHS